MGKTADGSPDFLGGLAQWTTADRFFCLSGGVKKSGQFRMFQRLKIRLGL
jgi:hypothetical protein